MDERNNIIVGALKGCESKVSVEETFNLYQVADTAQRIDRLNECMGNPQTFFSSGQLTAEEKYELTVQMFLTNSWKLQDYYDRMGVGNPPSTTLAAFSLSFSTQGWMRSS